jgi:hypothetical protein
VLDGTGGETGKTTLVTLAHILGSNFEEGRSYRPGSYRKPQRRKSPNSSGEATHAYLRARKNGLQTVLLVQVVENSMYFDAAGFPGRTVGLEKLALENGKYSAAVSRTAPAPKSGQGHRIAGDERPGYYRKIIWQDI